MIKSSTKSVDEFSIFVPMGLTPCNTLARGATVTIVVTATEIASSTVAGNTITNTATVFAGTTDPVTTNNAASGMVTIVCDSCMALASVELATDAGFAHSQSVAISGGVAPFTIAITKGSLPPGIQATISSSGSVVI